MVWCFCEENTKLRCLSLSNHIFDLMEGFVRIDSISQISDYGVQFPQIGIVIREPYTSSVNR